MKVSSEVFTQLKRVRDVRVSLPFPLRLRKAFGVLPFCIKRAAQSEGAGNPFVNSDEDVVARSFSRENLARCPLSKSLEGPSSAEHGKRVCSEISKHNKNTLARVGGDRSRLIIGCRKTTAEGRQIGCCWGIPAATTRYILATVRGRGPSTEPCVTRATPKIAGCVDARDFRGKSRVV